EGARIPDGEVGKNLPVHLDPSELQPVHEARVREIVQARRRIDADEPEPAKSPLAVPPAAIGIPPTALHRLLGGLIEILAAAEVALRMFQNAALALQARHVVANARHGRSSKESGCEWAALRPGSGA